MKTILIAALNFRVQQLPHLLANYNLCKELGMRPILLINKRCVDFVKGYEVEYITELKSDISYHYAIFWFPAIKNILLFFKLKIKNNTKLLYVFHEPFESFKTYLNSGNTFKWTFFFFLKYLVNLFIIIWPNVIILPSQKAIYNYKKSLAIFFNKNFVYMPLLYDDFYKVTDKKKRIYISYIGNVCKDHAFDEYVDYIWWLYKNDLRKSYYKFLIATRKVLPNDERIKKLKDLGLLDVKEGTFMTDYYSHSLVVWNAYNRSTQSGVLANAFMNATPAIIMKRNLSEFVKDGDNVKVIEDNKDPVIINSAIEDIIMNFEHYSDCARLSFIQNFYYKSQLSLFSEIIKSL